MKKGEENNGRQSEDQDEALTNSEFGFVYDFFTSESDSEAAGEKVKKDISLIEGKKEFQTKDQSITFFLPDFFSREDY